MRYNYSNIFSKIRLEGDSMKRSISYKSKLVLTYMLLITLPVLLFGIFIYKDFWSILKKQETDSVMEKLNQEVLTINLKLNDIENIAHYLSVNTQLTTFLREGPNTSPSNFVQNYNNKILPLVTWIQNTNIYIQDINIFTYNENINEVAMFHHISNYEDQSWLNNVLEQVSLGNPYWEPSHIARDYLDINHKKREVLSLWYIVNPFDPANTAYLELEINTRELFASTLYTYSSTNNKDQLVVMDTTGHIFSDNKKDNIVTQLVEVFDVNEILQGDQDYLAYSSNNTSYYAYYKKIAKLDTYFIDVFPEREIHRLLKQPMSTYIIMVFTTYALLILLAFTLSSILTKKIKVIRNSMKKIEEEDFDVHIQVNGKDELDHLAMDFNRMAFRINELINKVYKYEISKKQSELKALQAQIRPHFIYNTLESLRMLAEINDDEEVSDGLISLAKLIKQNLKKGTNTITIKQELSFLNHYIKVQNITHNNLIQLHCHIPIDLMDLHILTFTLQPIIENAVIHGFNGLPLNIFITGEKGKDELSIFMKNDGKPIEESKLEEICNQLEMIDSNQRESISHIGMVNVNKRLKLYYGETYGVKIMSSANETITVIVNMPVVDDTVIGGGKR